MLRTISLCAVLLAIIIPCSGFADFTEGNLFLVNQPSSGSAGYDFIDEISPEGSNLNTLIDGLIR